MSSSVAFVVQPNAWKIGTRAQGGIEFGYDHQYGAGDQTLDANHYISYGAEDQPTYHALELNGPQQLRNKVTIDHFHLAYSCLISFNDHFQLEPALGASHDSLKLESVGSALVSPIRSNVDQYGIYGSLTPRWMFNHFAAVELRIKGGLALNDNLSSSSTIIFNPAVVITPVKAVAISIGGASREQYFNGGLFDFDGSDVDMHLSGVSVGLRAIF